MSAGTNWSRRRTLQPRVVRARAGLEKDLRVVSGAMDRYFDSVAGVSSDSIGAVRSVSFLKVSAARRAGINILLCDKPIATATLSHVSTARK